MVRALPAPVGKLPQRGSANCSGLTSPHPQHTSPSNTVPVQTECAVTQGLSDLLACARPCPQPGTLCRATSIYLFQLMSPRTFILKELPCLISDFLYFTRGPRTPAWSIHHTVL